MKTIAGITPVCVSIVAIGLMLAGQSPAEEDLYLSFFLGMEDGSEASDGVDVIISIEEEGKETEVFHKHWEDQKWSDEFIVDLREWGGKTITLKIITDPGEARNTGWDWILIGDAKVIFDGEVIYDIGQAVAENKQENSMLIDGEKKERPGLGFGACCQIVDFMAGGEKKPKTIYQHPAWDGAVGNTIARFKIELPFAGFEAVEADGKLATVWGQLKAYYSVRSYFP